MEENDAVEWLVLKLECDNRTECSYLFQGSTFTDDVCAPADSVAYIGIDYTCLLVFYIYKNHNLIIN